MSENPKIERPLSPHLQIYKPQITSVLSILHRITGFGLSVGLVLFAAWLYGAAYDRDVLESVYSFTGSWVGMAFLFGWTVAFYYHLANGIRHLVWDMGCALDLESAAKTGYLVLGFTAGATFVTWVYLASAL
jgi:succinate dehydrogenase / fumarate reductase cytochrome b subunit